MFPDVRMRRLRHDRRFLDFLSEVRVDVRDMIQPLFFDSRLDKPEPIAAMPGQFKYPPSWGGKLMDRMDDLGIPAVMMFGIPDKKDPIGSMAYDAKGPVQMALEAVPDDCRTLLIADVCLCEYTDHGHCGILNEKGVDNDPSNKLHAKAAVSLAEAGADILAPSSMMDGVVGCIRHTLDDHGYNDRSILAYSAKFLSSLYSPFRDAADSCPMQGDRSGYQMNPANGREAMREVALDIQEGADMLMVKPALCYLDVVNELRRRTDVPIFAYQVSGEYSMIKNAGSCGIIDADAFFVESLLSIRRAGADKVITYYATEFAEKQQEAGNV